LFHVGILYRVQDLLEFINDQPITETAYTSGFSQYRGVSGKDILQAAIRFNWIRIRSGSIILTESGKNIVKCHKPSLKLRLQLQDILLCEPPPWIGLVKRGFSALKTLSENTSQCFYEAGLFEIDDPEVILWWDRIRAEVYENDLLEKIEVGRKGELLSLDLEKKRGVNPIWISVLDNDAGYDILSQLTPTDQDKLVIEVKTSNEDWDKASFYLTRNEWLILNSHAYAQVHLWSISKPDYTYAILDFQEVKKHIPYDYGSGEWQNVRIPFKSFYPNTYK